MHIVEPRECPFCKKRIGVVVDFEITEITRADPVYYTKGHSIKLRPFDLKDIKEELANEKEDN